MTVTNLLADPAAIEIDAFVSNTDSITIRVHSIQPVAFCPDCNEPSGSLKCRYLRQIADLPWHGVAVRLELHTRKFRCRNELCQRKVFCERLLNVADVYARKTVRLNEAIVLLAFALGGRPGSKTAIRLNLPASKDTLIRLIRRNAMKDVSQEKTRVKILGVDDFAFLKGHSYGTILVDLEGHCVIDLLPDREAETLKLWLEEHLEVEIVSRDRSNAYADGARRGSPEARQVADRFHLLKNLREALENFLGRQHSLLKQAHETIKARHNRDEKLSDGNNEKTCDNGDQPRQEVSNLKKEQIIAKHERRLERFKKVKELHEKHYPISAIARTLKMHRRTVRLFLRSEKMPIRKVSHPPHSLGCFISYLEKRWSEGEHNAAKLWRELKEKGFRGSDSLVRHYLRNWREPVPEEAKRKTSKNK